MVKKKHHLICLSDEEIERRAAIILATSLEQAKAESTDWICSYDLSTMWIATEKRSTAIRTFINETDPSMRAKDIACRREWMRVDFDAIDSLADDMATDEQLDEEDVATAIAYTWEGESFTWSPCKRTDERAMPFWRCECNA